jgi:HlyD family secretion protein
MANGINGNGQSGIGRTWIYVGAIIAVVILVSAFMSLRPRRIRVTVVHPHRQDITRTITTNGKVEPIQNFEAHAPLATTVRKILVQEGQKVKKGQLLFQLDDAGARAQLAKAEAQLKAAEVGSASLRQGGSTEEVLTRQADLTKAQTELDAANRNVEAVQRLQQKGAASQDELVAAKQRAAKAQADVNLLHQKTGSRYSVAERSRTEADVADARAAVSAAQQMLEDSNIRAPFDGVVYAVPVRQGAWVNAGDLLIEEADVSAMQVRTYVDEPEIGQLAPGQNVSITWDAIPGRVWNGKVKSVPTTVVQHGTRTVGEVMCSVDNSDGKLLPNTNVNALITTSSRPGALVVAREALRDDGGKSVLFVVKGDHLVRTEVQTGVANLTQVEILKGISENDVIASQSVSPTGMSDGIGVKIVENTQ